MRGRGISAAFGRRRRCGAGGRRAAARRACCWQRWAAAHRPQVSLGAARRTSCARRRASGGRQTGAHRPYEAWSRRRPRRTSYKQFVLRVGLCVRHPTACGRRRGNCCQRALGVGRAVGAAQALEPSSGGRTGATRAWKWARRRHHPLIVLRSPQAARRRQRQWQARLWLRTARVAADLGSRRCRPTLSCRRRVPTRRTSNKAGCRWRRPLLREANLDLAIKKQQSNF